MLDFTGRRALITGATGGIGGAIAKLLHQYGAHIVISGTKEEVLKQVQSELKERVDYIVCNLSDREQVNSLIDNCETKFGPLDILVCNAGITRDNLSIRMSEEDFEEVIKINLTSSFILNKAALKLMLKRRYGRIINISSIIGATGNAGQANYAASKAGLIAMTKSMAKESASRNITMNCVAPGFIATNMTDKLKEEYKAELLKSIPAGRMGEAEEIANAVIFLASDKASYITGQTIHVNGGMAMI